MFNFKEGPHKTGNKLSEFSQKLKVINENGNRSPEYLAAWLEKEFGKLETQTASTTCGVDIPSDQQLRALLQTPSITVSILTNMRKLTDDDPEVYHEVVFDHVELGKGAVVSAEQFIGYFLEELLQDYDENWQKHNLEDVIKEATANPDSKSDSVKIFGDILIGKFFTDILNLDSGIKWRALRKSIMNSAHIALVARMRLLAGGRKWADLTAAEKERWKKLWILSGNVMSTWNFGMMFVSHIAERKQQPKQERFVELDLDAVEVFDDGDGDSMYIPFSFKSTRQ